MNGRWGSGVNGWWEPVTHRCECGRHLHPDEPSAAPGAPEASSPAREAWREAQEAVERQSRPRSGVGVAADPEETR